MKVQCDYCNEEATTFDEESLCPIHYRQRKQLEEAVEVLYGTS
jgi:hypothetical protein